LCVVEGTSAAAVTARAALLWKAPLLTAALEDVSDCMTQKQTEDWLCQQRIRSQDEFSEDHPQWTVRVSPPLCAPAHGECPKSELSIPGIAAPPGGAINDCLLFALSEQIYVTHCRSKGTIEALLKHYLCEGRHQGVPCFLEEDVYRRIIEGNDHVSGTAVRWLVNDGAILVPPKTSYTPSIPTSLPTDKDRASPDDRDSPLHQPSHWLLHWTRARYGPWPGQAAEDWLDELIRGDAAAARSDLITLAKIISDGILTGSKTGIRGGYRGVSFTEVPITEFRRRRIFRRHRNRFDFQPWGVAVRRDVLRSYGIRPVIYGDDHDWKSMSEADRPWFQKRTTGDGATNNLAEREWRLMGDLKLSELKPEDVCYFVDNETDAEFLRSRTASPVVVVP
jgi:hypothetical protein